jgi:acyl dehydratase
VSAALRVEPVTRLLDQARVDAYARAARDPNPLHLDAQVARRSGFEGTIAHGMLVLALVSEAMSAAFGRRWAEGGSLKIRWRAPALIPLTVTARAELRSEQDGVVTYDVTCEDEQGRVLLTGAASAPVT